MSEDRIWRVAQSVGFDDYELKPMLEAFAAALSKPAPSPQSADSDDQDAKWRDVALRFDKHRMSALWHLQALLKDPARHAEVVRKFLSDPTHPNVQPAAPVVSDEQIDPLVQKHARATWSGSQQDWDVVEFSRLGLVMFANAILALRPDVKPMTPEKMRKAAMDEMSKIPALANHHSWKGWPGTWAFATAAVNGITAKAEGVCDGRST